MPRDLLPTWGDEILTVTDGDLSAMLVRRKIRWEGNKMNLWKTLVAGAAIACAPFVVQAQNLNGWFKLQTMFQAPEGKCFEGNRFAQGSTLGGAAFMDNCQNVSGQLWRLIPAQDGYFRLTTMFLEGENKCLEGNRFSPDSTLGGAAFMDNCQNVSGQLWKLVPR